MPANVSRVWLAGIQLGRDKPFLYRSFWILDNYDKLRYTAV